jgi:hypothetical protein
MKEKGKSFNNLDNILCSYGCEKIAKYIQTSGKYCCEEWYTKCLANRLKYSSPGSKNPMYGKKSANSYNTEEWKRKYYILFEIGEAKINEQNEIDVICKECKKWFKPSYETFRARYNALDHGNKRHYFFCSDECKLKSISYRLKYEPENLKKFREYQRIVRLKTEATVKKHSHKIPNIELRDRYHPIDHKYSIRSAFENNISIDVVSHWKNLEITTIYENSSKNKKCTIEIEELIKEISNVIINL